jgi:two-component system, cell cycle sensor histidine kinase and response regulator CckA
MPRALIVDDHEANLYLLRSVLAGHGYEVVSAADGRAALEAARASRPDIIVSDILMPVMDGFTLCRTIRQDESLKDVPFVFYTATYTDPRDEQLALGVGGDLFLVKPVEPDVLVERIAGLLDRRDVRRPNGHSQPDLDDVKYLKEYSKALIRKLEDKLAEVEEANRALLVKGFAIESAPSGILLVDLDGTVSYGNPAAASMVGRSRELLHRVALDALFGSCGHWEEASAAIHRSGCWTGELETTGAGPRALKVAVHTVVSGDGQAICRMVTMEDVSARKRLAQEVQRSQRLASLSLFAAGVAHDFNNLLMGVFGNIELAASTLAPDHQARTHLQHAGVAFERARDLTRRLLTFAKGSPPVRRTLLIADLLRECGSLALAGSGVECQLVAEPALWPLTGDANQLSQVFTNVLLNARQAMNDRGLVRVAVENEEVAEPSDAGPVQRYVTVTVSDEGPGISEEAQKHLFDPLFTTKPGGSGLGLATSYAIVRAHGGWIEVKSSPREGATVRVLLPVSDSATADTEKEERGIAACAPAGRKARVLVMDDEAPVRELAARMLERHGYEVTTAEDGAEVLELCEQAVHGSKPFDAVILDVTVPGGMGGREALPRLNQRHASLPVVMSSGYGPDAWSGGDGRPAAILPKPYRMHELLACIGAVIAERRGRKS